MTRPDIARVHNRCLILSQPDVPRCPRYYRLTSKRLQNVALLLLSIWDTGKLTFFDAALTEVLASRFPGQSGMMPTRWPATWVTEAFFRGLRDVGY
jgi:hypothetical protein